MVTKIALAVCYLLAAALHQIVRANQSANSTFTPWDTVREYAARFWPTMVTRFVLGTAIYALWWTQPTWTAAVLPFGELPLTYGTSIIYGWFSDSLLEKILSRFNVKLTD